MNSFWQLWRTSTVRLTATFILIFSLFAILLLAFIGWQSSVQIQRQQADEIEARILRKGGEAEGGVGGFHDSRIVEKYFTRMTWDAIIPEIPTRTPFCIELSGGVRFILRYRSRKSHNSTK